MTTALLSVSVLSAPAYADDKALIVGVGEYENPAIKDLEGINYDVDMATNIAKRLGISETNITTLADNQATLANVRSAFRNIANNTSRDDKVLIYFSGHGSQVEDTTGDEEDGQDETIVMHDGATQTVQVKSFYDAELQDKNLYVEPVTQDADIQANSYISIGAAQDNQQSLATKDGSIFTKKLFESFEETRKKSNTTTWKNLYNSTKQKIESLPLPDNRRFTPRLEGKGVSKQILIADPTTSSSKVNWNDMIKNINKMDNDIQVNAPKNLNVGDVLEFDVTAPDDGYLYVITVGADDETTVLFPNEYATNNRVTANQKLTLPGNGKFRIRAKEPRGNSMIAVLHTSDKVNLQDKGFGLFDNKGMSKGNVFAKGSSCVFLDALGLSCDKNFILEGADDTPTPRSNSDKKGKYVIINVK